MALAFHPVAWVPLIFVGLVPWLVAVRRCGEAGFIVGFCVGNTVYGAWLMAWVCTVVGWAGPVGWVLLTLLWFVLSLPFAWVLKTLLVKWNGVLFWVLPAAVVAQDIFRFWALGGVTWHSAGFALADWNTLVQVAEVGGVWGLTWLVMAANALVADWILDGRVPEERRRLMFQSVGWCAALAGFLLFGAVRKSALDSEVQLGPTVVGLQGNIEQDMKIYSGPGGRLAMRDRHVSLFRAAEADGVQADLIVWPETSLVPGWDQSAAAKDSRRLMTPQNRLSRRLSGRRTTLSEELRPRNPKILADHSLWPRHLIGLITRDDAPEAGGETRTRNTVALAVPAQGSKDDYEWSLVYHKRKLVPFGEYLPIPTWLPWRESLEQSILEAAGYVPDMSPGTDAVVAPLNTGRGQWGFDIGVCFEMLFPRLFEEARANGVDFTVNVSNDAWYGNSAELDLVHRQGIFRAIETRLSLVRVSNTGISTVLDPAGRSVMTVEENGRKKRIGGVLVAQVPVGATHLTGQPRHNYLAWFYLMCFLTITVCAWRRWNRRKQPSSVKLSA
jgi:apolipoprotein N-acyltransferase